MLFSKAARCVCVKEQNAQEHTYKRSSAGGRSYREGQSAEKVTLQTRAHNVLLEPGGAGHSIGRPLLGGASAGLRPDSVRESV